MNAKVVFHLDWDEEPRLIMALNNIENLLKDNAVENATVYLVANGVSVKLLRQERAAEYAGRIKKLADTGVKFYVCNNSLRNLEIKPEELVDGCQVIPAGITELIRLQDEGCAYVKP